MGEPRFVLYTESGVLPYGSYTNIPRFRSSKLGKYDVFRCDIDMYTN